MSDNTIQYKPTGDAREYYTAKFLDGEGLGGSRYNIIRNGIAGVLGSERYRGYIHSAVDPYLMDRATLEQEAAKNQDWLDKSWNTVKGIGVNLLSGILQGTAAVANAWQSPVSAVNVATGNYDRDFLKDRYESTLYDWGDALRRWNDDNNPLFNNEDRSSAAYYMNQVVQAANSLGSMIPTAGTAFSIGSGVGAFTGGVGGAVTSSVLLGIFNSYMNAMETYHDTIEKGVNAGLSMEEAKSAGRMAADRDFTTEVFPSIFLGNVVGGRLGRLGARTLLGRQRYTKIFGLGGRGLLTKAEDKLTRTWMGKIMDNRVGKFVRGGIAEGLQEGLENISQQWGTLDALHSKGVLANFDYHELQQNMEGGFWGGLLLGMPTLFHSANSNKTLSDAAADNAKKTSALATSVDETADPNKGDNTPIQPPQTPNGNQPPTVTPPASANGTDDPNAPKKNRQQLSYNAAGITGIGGYMQIQANYLNGVPKASEVDSDGHILDSTGNRSGYYYGTDGKLYKMGRWGAKDAEVNTAARFDNTWQIMDYEHNNDAYVISREGKLLPIDESESAKRISKVAKDRKPLMMKDGTPSNITIDAYGIVRNEKDITDPVLFLDTRSDIFKALKDKLDTLGLDHGKQYILDGDKAYIIPDSYGDKMLKGKDLSEYHQPPTSNTPITPEVAPITPETEPKKHPLEIGTDNHTFFSHTVDRIMGTIKNKKYGQDVYTKSGKVIGWFREDSLIYPDDSTKHKYKDDTSPIEFYHHIRIYDKDNEFIKSDIAAHPEDYIELEDGSYISESYKAETRIYGRFKGKYGKRQYLGGKDTGLFIDGLGIVTHADGKEAMEVSPEDKDFNGNPTKYYVNPHSGKIYRREEVVDIPDVIPGEVVPTPTFIGDTPPPPQEGKGKPKGKGRRKPVKKAPQQPAPDNPTDIYGMDMPTDGDGNAGNGEEVVVPPQAGEDILPPSPADDVIPPAGDDVIPSPADDVIPSQGDATSDATPIADAHDSSIVPGGMGNIEVAGDAGSIPQGYGYFPDSKGRNTLFILDADGSNSMLYWGQHPGEDTNAIYRFDGTLADKYCM